MRNGISINVSRSDRRRLQALVADRNASQKHVWRAEIVLLTADGLGTNEIMRRTAKSKTCVWRWQERFMEEGFEGLHLAAGGLQRGFLDLQVLVGGANPGVADDGHPNLHCLICL